MAVQSPSPIPVRVLLALAAVLACAAGAGAEPAKADPAKADPRVAIAKRLEVEVDAVRASQLPGIFEVARGADVLYVSGDGKYALDGDLFETATGHNLTEKRRIAARALALKAVPDSEAIIFAPEKPLYTVYVFTDVDCAYCRALHKEIAEYNRRGVRVKYLFFPRTGPGTDSWHKAEAVWCAPDRREALTLAKTGAPIPGKGSCGPTPIEKTYELGKDLGIRGTPGIFTERGEYLVGYLAPDALVKRLRELEAGAAPGG